MDYVQNAFYEATGWNRDNSYGTLTATSRNLLDFEPPSGLRFHVSSLSSPSFASSYTLGSTGLVDGSLSYLYSSRPLDGLASKSNAIDLRSLVPGYRQLRDLRQPDEASWWEIWHQGKRIDRRHALLYGRLFLPRSTLEALYMRRVNPSTQFKVSCVSDSRLPNGGTILAHFQYDRAKHCTEYIYSTDSALLGVRGLYNFGPPPSDIITFDRSTDVSFTTAKEVADLTMTLSPRPHGLFSAGGEIYYGLLNKSGGLSMGLRFATLPSHTGFPYTMTLTVNPLMGNLSSSYSVLASPLMALSSRFDFNVYSYESELQVGAELWRRKTKPELDNLQWARLKMGSEIIRPITDDAALGEGLSGCLKGRADQRGRLALLWEGRVKELLYSCGMIVDIRGGENMFRGIGVEVQYSS
ncbi:MAG: hypothetical protein Q9163_002966 [Psora crenata]